MKLLVKFYMVSFILVKVKKTSNNAAKCEFYNPPQDKFL